MSSAEGRRVPILRLPERLQPTERWEQFMKGLVSLSALAAAVQSKLVSGVVTRFALRRLFLTLSLGSCDHLDVISFSLTLFSVFCVVEQSCLAPATPARISFYGYPEPSSSLRPIPTHER